MTPLIDATEMYLRTLFELEEEGITPIRARLVERLGLSAPAVSETVMRLQQDGLMHVADDRRLELTATGREIALSVMRKHRLAELLLTDIIGLEWEQVHNEACRWEHVISDAVERRLTEVLGDPVVCPHGNPIPPATAPEMGVIVSMAVAAKSGGSALIRRISERLQVDVEAMRFLRERGLRPGVATQLRLSNGAVVAEVDGAAVQVPADVAEQVYVTAGKGPPHLRVV